jgi:hypothetical protein
MAIVATLFDLLDPEIGRIIQRRLPTRVNQSELIGQRVAVGELGQQVGALIEPDQEEVVVAVGGLDEGLQRVSGAVEFHSLHAPRHVEDDP